MIEMSHIAVLSQPEFVEREVCWAMAGRPSRFARLLAALRGAGR